MNEREFVLDASAVLALLQDEPGAMRVEEILPMSLISAVNLAEVVTKITEFGISDVDIVAQLDPLELEVEPFDRTLALHAGAMRAATRHLGLSLGDRACLATAATIGRVAVTADKAWAKLDLDIPVELLR